MSFGSSVGDIILLIQLAHKNYRNCKEAGGEYLEIAREVRSLHGVLKTVRDEAEREDSLIFRSGSGKTQELVEIADGCKGVLEGIDVLLTKYKGLAPESKGVGKTSKLWQRFRFGTEIEDLGKLRWKIITYTSTLAVLVDSINLKATERVGNIAGRIESQMGNGFAEMRDRLEGFEDMRKAVLFIATRARASQQYQSMESVLSLSTYADDDKEVWRQFRSQLVSLGFKSDSLDRHMEILKAYMMKLDQTGVLEEAVQQTGTSTLSWCGNASFRTTNLSLLGTLDREQSDAEKHMEEAQDTSPVETPREPNPQGQTYQQQDLQAMQRGELNRKVSDEYQSTDSKRRRIPRIKVEGATSVEAPESEPTVTKAQFSNFTLAGGKSSTHDASVNEKDTDYQNHASSSHTSNHHAAYAESYYSISEAGTSQLMLSIDTSGLEKSLAASRRLQQLNRPKSWAGPESQNRSNRRPELWKVIGYNSESDSTVKDRRVTTRKAKNSLVGNKEKVDDWLYPRDKSRQARANSSSRPQRSTSSSSKEKKDFPDDLPPITIDGFLKDTKNYNVPSDAKWTKINRVLVSPTALEAGNEDFQANKDLVIVHRVLSRVELRGYVEATQRLRSARRQEEIEASYRRRSQRDVRNTDGGWSYGKSNRPSLATSKSESSVKYHKVKKGSKYQPRVSQPTRFKFQTDPEPDLDSKRERYSKGERPTSFTAYANTTGSNQGAGDNMSFDFKQRRRSQSPEARINGKEVPASDLTLATKAAVLAGATEAFRARNEPGSWTGEKARRILTAAIGAGGIGAVGENELPPQQQQHQAPPANKGGLLESVIAGLAMSRLVNGVRYGNEEERKADGSVDTDSDSYFTSDLDSDSSRGRPKTSQVTGLAKKSAAVKPSRSS
ncbi:hypothetical protein VTL71DRAFT_14022 [Oculimacula yallundae]|uniref:DUF8035 domain-containing protein n=1 Tax=Oculimacula yallundae TaxID=86028 RepID=A0ABR4CP46_9HELO